MDETSSTAPPPAALAWTALAQALAAPLAEAAGPGAAPVSIAIDLAAVPFAQQGLACRAWVERGTRTLVFLGAEARARDGALAASATAVFRRA